jgi:hypothetical protein
VGCVIADLHLELFPDRRGGVTDFLHDDAKLIHADPKLMRPAFYFLRIGDMNLAAIGGFFSGQGIHVNYPLSKRPGRLNPSRPSAPKIGEHDGEPQPDNDLGKARDRTVALCLECLDLTLRQHV